METRNTSEFERRWGFVRSETLEILDSLSQDDLRFVPAPEKWQPMYTQFACIARTQMVYCEALKTLVMDFSLFKSAQLPPKSQFENKQLTLSCLIKADQTWLEAVRAKANNEIAWPNQKISVENHIMRLAEHERLHHGQLIAYFGLAGIALPAGFSKNWSL